MLDAYYEFKGWNNDGIPTRETLDALGLVVMGSRDEFAPVEPVTAMLVPTGYRYR